MLCNILLTFVILGGALLLLISENPTFSLIGIIIQSVAYSGLLCHSGFPFLGLVLILIYVGAMLVVFLFATLLSAEESPFVSAWGLAVAPVVVLGLGYSLLSFWMPSGMEISSKAVNSEIGFVEAFSSLGLLTCFIGFILLLALIIVLILSFEHKSGALRSL
uniref:NADH-ubiquinone oxidoreductase chain 6 n=1 Tax=Aspidophiura sp. TaxID=3135528 RepID=A0AAU6QCJ7_9ECHI